MSHDDIKLVIDRLHAVDTFIAAEDNLAVAEAISTLETLGNQVAKQATALREAKEALCLPCDRWNKTQFQIVNKAIATIEATSTDSTQVLQEWLDEKLGEPVGEIHKAHARPIPEMDHWCKEILMYSPNSPYDLHEYRIPLFKKPKILSF